MGFEAGPKEKQSNETNRHTPFLNDCKSISKLVVHHLVDGHYASPSLLSPTKKFFQGRARGGGYEHEENRIVLLAPVYPVQIGNLLRSLNETL